MRTSRTLLSATALVIATGTLPACGSGDGGGGGTPGSGGTLTFAVGSDMGCVDPQQVGSNDTIYSVRQLVDSLTDQDPRTGKIVPWLAQSWTVSDDATTFTFRLRPGVTFSDGTPLTAKTVKANFDAIPGLGPRATLGNGYLSGYKGTEVLDDLTAKVSFEQPNAQFLQATSTHSLGLVSDATAAKPAQERCTKGIAGSGPFTLRRYVPNQTIELAKRADYTWGSALFTKQGPAYLDRLVFKVLPESGVRVGGLTSGQVDAIGAVGRADEAALKGAGARLLARANPGIVFGVSLNSKRAPFTDEKVRRAVSLAVDRRQVAATVFPSGTRPATSVLSHTTPGYHDLGADLAHDKARAAALLDSAGWTTGPDGIRRKDGRPLRFVITWFANAATNQPSLELILQQLKAVGVQAELKQIQMTELATVQADKDFDALWGNLTRADPDILRGQFSTRLLNTYNVPPTGLDRLLDGQSAQTDETQRFDLVRQAQQEIVRHAYTVPVVELQTVLGTARKVRDLKFDASSRIQLHDTWIE